MVRGARISSLARCAVKPGKREGEGAAGRFRCAVQRRREVRRTHDWLAKLRAGIQWIPAPRFREDKLRGNDITDTNTVIPLISGNPSADFQTSPAPRVPVEP